jgi:hypothetical protein
MLGARTSGPTSGGAEFSAKPFSALITIGNMDQTAGAFISRLKKASLISPAKALIQ